MTFLLLTAVQFQVALWSAEGAGSDLMRAAIESPAVASATGKIQYHEKEHMSNLRGTSTYLYSTHVFIRCTWYLYYDKKDHF